ncbi:AGE family epimerase/isomerase [Spirosoma montaniterrae]|uniref:N-acyl-D-glucosamine 2-epimerase n=1 Tax=Spirosoma montaniterrae TaxID=1178516 RepID=A0A1P9WZV1_9BACT|nr:AGE family epimerase/isomerase [Spirosoma montaniterrae]AQG80916.1 N-acyl-D-glucosamine 2-epimerase [Spirosoma montaniterrae]
MIDFQKLTADYKGALLEQVVPFWLKHSSDGLCGGYFDLLSATGEIIDGNKYVSLQAQQTWAFAWLYANVEKQPAWLEHARQGGVFLRQFAHHESGTWYAQLDRRGRPVALAADSTPVCFLAMAYAQLYAATANDEWAALAKQTFAHGVEACAIRTNAVDDRLHTLHHLSEPATLLQATLTMQPLFDEDANKEHVDAALSALFGTFLEPRANVLHEYALPGSAFLNTPEGRSQHVGLTFRVSGLLLDAYAGTKNQKITAQVLSWCLRTCELAWDEVSAGLLTRIDQKQQPNLRSDWQLKWAWVQLEALNTLAKLYWQTRHPDCAKWFRRIHDYTFARFPDSTTPGWHLLLDIHHQPVLGAKATPDVGCFSQIRCLAETAQLLTKAAQIQPTVRRSWI